MVSCLRSWEIRGEPTDLLDQVINPHPFGPHKGSVALLPTSCSPSHVLSSHVPLQELFIDSKIINYSSTYLTYSTNIVGRNQFKVAVTGPRIAPDRSSASTRHNQPSATSSSQDLGIEIRISNRFEESRRNSSTFTWSPILPGAGAA